MKKSSLNLEYIAERAGVSRATVSRVVNNHPYVKEKTRTHVMQIIEKEGYTPNLVARALVTQRTQVIGVVIPHTLSVVFEDPFYFPSLLQGINQVTNARDYSMMLWIEDNQNDMQKFYERILKQHLIDGLILASYQTDHPYLGQFTQVNSPMVLIEKAEGSFEGFSCVTIDNVEAAQQAVTYLQSLGRKRIGTICGNLENPDGRDRRIGYRNAMQQSPLGYDPDLEVGGMFARKTGYNGMMQLLEKKVDAVFCANDQIAFGALDALAVAGIECPRQVSIIGFDDLPAAALSKPSLTTVRQPIRRRGSMATSILLDEIEGLQDAGKQFILPTELIIRESCGGSPK
jgi:LacI family transcriptional regulator